MVTRLTRCNNRRLFEKPTVLRALRLKDLDCQRLLRSLMLPLLLLLAQQGAVLHELGHCAAAHAHQDKKQQPARDEVCDLCLVFSHVDATAASISAVVPLLAHLCHELAPVLPVAAGGLELPAQRSRGPPRFL